MPPVVTLDDDERIDTGAGRIRVMAAREWFFESGSSSDPAIQS